MHELGRCIGLLDELTLSVKVEIDLKRVNGAIVCYRSKLRRLSGYFVAMRVSILPELVAFKGSKGAVRLANISPTAACSYPWSRWYLRSIQPVS
jgi:hypothetical protein